MSRCGSEYDELGQPCTIVVGSDVSRTEDGKVVLAGALINLNNTFAKVVVNAENEILFEEIVDL